jgi:hypothetical protein
MLEMLKNRRKADWRNDHGRLRAIEYAFQKREDVDIRPERFANLLKLGIVQKTELGMEWIERKLIDAVDDEGEYWWMTFLHSV